MAIDFEKLYEEARKRDGLVRVRTNPEPTNVKKILQPPKKTEKKKPTRKRKLDSSTRRKQLEAVADNAIPKTMHNFTEGYLKGMSLGFIKPDTTGENADVLERIREGKGAKVSNIAGTMLAYASPYSVGKNILAKGATKAVSSKLGTKAAGKLAASKLGQKVGEGTVKTVAHAIAEDAIGALTIGEAQNIGMALNEGKRGKELIDDVALNTVADLVVGGALSGLPLLKGLKKGGTKIPTVLPNGKIKYVDAPTNLDTDYIKAFEAKRGKKLAQDGLRVRLKDGKYIPQPKIDIEPIKTKDVASEIPMEHNIGNRKLQRLKQADSIDSRRSSRLGNRTLQKGTAQTKSVNTKRADNLRQIDEGIQGNISLDNERALLPTFNDYDEGLKYGEKRLAEQEAAIFNAQNIEKYGAMPRTSRQLPKRMDYGTQHTDAKVSEAARTVFNSEAMRNNPEARKTVKQAVAEGAYIVEEVSNRKALEESMQKIAQNVDEALESHRATVLKGKSAQVDDMAHGIKLGEELAKQGRFDEMNEVYADVAMWMSDAGRTLQAGRMFNALTPSGRMQNVAKISRKIAQKTGVDIKVPDNLLEAYVNAVDEKEIFKIQKEISTAVWNQVPGTYVEKMNAWRYLSMLMNPKTHIRNIVGNALFMPARAMKDVISTGLEKTFSKQIAAGGGVRTKAIVGYTGEDKNLREAGKKAFLNVQGALMQNSSKFSDSYRDIDSVVFDGKHASKVFGERVGGEIGSGLDKLSKLNSNLLEGEDKLFMGINFQSAFAEYCKANGLKASDLTEEIIKKASDYAQLEAQKATYRDFNAIADIISEARHQGLRIRPDDTTGVKAVKVAGQALMDSAMPFVKTPMNIMRRGVEYSPIGLMQGSFNIAKAIKQGNGVALTKAIDRLAAGTTGTGLMAIGYYLASKGIANGKLGYDKEGYFKRSLGEQDYALTIPALNGEYSVTADWAAPLSMPFFVGVELFNTMQESKQNPDPLLIAEILLKTPEPVFNLSMMQGVNNIFSTQFGADDGAGAIGDILANVGENYAMQYIPTIAGQVARTLSPTRKTTISTQRGKIGRELDKTLQRMGNKLPFVTSLNEDYIDQWGEPEQKAGIGDYLMAAGENFLSPAYFQKKSIDNVEQNILDLADNLDPETAKEIIPTSRRAAYDFKFAGDKYRMKKGDVTDYAINKGQYQRQALENLMTSEAYKDMTAEEKKDAIKKIYDKANEYARESMIVNREIGTREEVDYDALKKNPTLQRYVKDGLISATDARAIRERASDNSARGNVEKALIALENGADREFINAYTSEDATRKAEAIKQAGLSLDDALDFYSTVKSYGADTDAQQAYIALESGMPIDTVRTLTSDNAIIKATKMKELGVDFEQYRLIEETKNKYGTATYAQAYALLDAGINHKIVSAVLDQKENRAVQSATLLKMMNVTPDEVLAIRQYLGTNRGDILAAYLSQTDYSRKQKWAIFNALSRAKNNPFS